MNIHQRRARPVRPARSPEEIEAEFRLALIWREIWRAEKAAPPSPQPSAAKVALPPDEAEHKKVFAKSIARLEFGRAYWDEKRQGGAKQTPERSRKIKR